MRSLCLTLGGFMIIISYDISDNKKRAKFSKYIKKFGHMLQYSVYQIDNSDRILDNIVSDINNKFMKIFDQNDSVYIFHMTSKCRVEKFGYARNEDKSLLIIK